MNLAEASLPSWIATNEETSPDIFKEYQYPVSSWPVIIDQPLIDRLSVMSRRVPQLIAQIPELYFNNNVKALADYYLDGNTMLAEFALLCHNKGVQVSSRLDLTYTHDGFKVLESNIGSTIGGWQVQSFESIIRRSHPELNNPVTAGRYTTRNIQLLYFEFLVEKTLEYVTDTNGTVNIFLTLEDTTETEVVEQTYDLLSSLLSEALGKKNLSGGLFFKELRNLRLVGKDLYYEEDRMHCVINITGEQIPLEILKSFIMDRIYLPDNLGTNFTKDKRNLGILRTLAERGAFGADDNQLIMETIPFTCPVEPSQVRFEGQCYDLVTLLREQQDRFVIKVADGRQGIDVYVGRHVSSEAWEEAIQLGLGDKAFIAQEFCDSVNFLAPNPDNEWAEHKLIWGSFGFGDTYGGVWVRMSFIGTDTGVINSATGAVEAIVFEHTDS
ncbi:MAG: hypothetical protein AAF466_12900 [Bacteroidota bacterium]